MRLNRNPQNINRLIPPTGWKSCVSGKETHIPLSHHPVFKLPANFPFEIAGFLAEMDAERMLMRHQVGFVFKRWQTMDLNAESGPG